MDVHQHGSGKAGFPLLLLKGASSKQLSHRTLGEMKMLNSSPSIFGLAKYSAFWENEYFLSWRTEVRYHSGKDFLHLFFFFLHIFK